MKSVKFLSLFSLTLSAFILFSAVANAQQDPSYAPPPMFDDLTPPMVRPPAKDGYIVAPMASPKSATPDTSASQPKPGAIAPRVSVDPNSSRPQPAPSKPYIPVAPVAPTAPKAVAAPPAPPKPKMMQPIIESPKTAKPAAPQIDAPVVEKPSPLPVPPPAPVATPTPQPVKRDPAVSAITGPKTMPALPMEEVGKDVTFEKNPEPPASETILERHQSETMEKATETLTPVAPLPNANVTPATFEPSDQGILKKSIVLTPGQIGLVPADLDPIAAGVAKELGAAGKEDWRVQIRAYATPYGAGLSSDRRIALNRSLSLRTGLIEAGVAASRIDVLAEGLQTDNSKPADRIDIYLYGPAQD